MRYLKVTCIIILFAWISFFPQPIQDQYRFYARIFFLGFLLLLVFNKTSARQIFSFHDWPLWLFMISMSSGMVLAIDKNTAIAVYFYIIITFFLLFYIGKGFCKTEQDRTLICALLCIFGSLVAIIGFMELYFGRNILYESFIVNPYYDKFIGPTLPLGLERYERYTSRPMSTQLEPSILGAYLLVCLPFSLYFFKNKLFYLRLLGILSSVLCIVMIILSLSRVTFLALIIVLLFYLWYKHKRRIIIVLACFILLISIGSCYPDSKLSRYGISEMVYGRYDSIVSEHRFSRIIMTAKIIKDSPFFGVGFNHFRIRFNEYCNKEEKEKVPYEYMVPDNMYLTFLAETGIIGTTSFLIFIFLLLKRAIRKYNWLKDSYRRHFLLISISALIGLLVNMAGYELFYWYNPFMFFCLLSGLIAFESDEH